MLTDERTFYLATRGSALALAQANLVLAQCRAAFPKLDFQLKIIKTTGDKLQTASLAQEGKSLPKGLFTKELEVALLEQQADLAVHSLKDLPTDLPTGLVLGAVGRREDVRDVLIYRDEHSARPAQGPAGHAVRRGFKRALRLAELPAGAVVATSSTRRKAQVLTANPALKVPDIRGNVLTRLQKVSDKAELDATILALAGLTRLRFRITPGGDLEGEGVPQGLAATILEIDAMMPCVGQGAVGMEIREKDERALKVCQALNHSPTHQCVSAERAFLAAMGGGCQSPVAAYAEPVGEELWMCALSFVHGPVRRAQAKRSSQEALELGRQLAEQLKV
ncbi:Porphobilinogen deaminase [Verrucomicrobia bacterium]|nr:Porphobilinogen deaminase [Verrucomicrobiota bacterium]